MSIMRTLENLWLQQKLGNLSKEQFDGHLDILRWSISLPLTRELWADIEGSFDPGFRAVVVEQALSKDLPEVGMIGAASTLRNYLKEPR